MIPLRFSVVLCDTRAGTSHAEYFATLSEARGHAAAIRAASSAEGRWCGGHPVLSEHQWHQRDHVTRQQIRTLRIEQAQPPRGDDR